MQTKMLIDGELIAGEGPKLAVLDPATGQEIAEIAEASSEQIDAAAAASSRAFADYSRTTPAERASYLLALADAIEANREELAALESQDVGKPWPSALDDEMPLTIETWQKLRG